MLLLVVAVRVLFVRPSVKARRDGGKRRRKVAFNFCALQPPAFPNSAIQHVFSAALPIIQEEILHRPHSFLPFSTHIGIATRVLPEQPRPLLFPLPPQSPHHQYNHLFTDHPPLLFYLHIGGRRPRRPRQRWPRRHVGQRRTRRRMGRC